MKQSSAIATEQEIEAQLIGHSSQEASMDSELQDEMRAWDTLSDEAFLNFEDSIE